MKIENIIDQVNQQAGCCSCGTHGTIQMVYHSKPNALLEVFDYLKQRGLKQTLLVADENTWAAAGEQLAQLLHQENQPVTLCKVTPNSQGDIIADEPSIVEIMLAVKETTDHIIAVGSGTLHDMVRFVCFKLGKSFISVPTAASVDGFTSVGAPIIVRGVKQTIPAIYPEAVFADTDILHKAPHRLTAAGFGDMIGKYTSLADAVFSRDLGGEPFCPLAYQLTEQALQSCVQQAGDIGKGTKEGVQQLFDALTLSGLAILIAGHSRTASGAEHHLSHYWEMEYIKQGKPQLLHGVKVGIASVLIARLYEQLQQSGLSPHETAYTNLPKAKRIAELLRAAGAPVHPSEAGLTPELVKAALLQAHHLRERYTGLRWIHETGKLDLIDQITLS